MLIQFVALSRAARVWRVRRFVSMVVAGTLAGTVFTQVAVADGTGNNNNNQASGTTTWGGLGWGVGIATDFDIGGKRVTNASIVNGLVRVSDTSSNVGIGFVLEAHYFFRDWLLGSPTPRSCKGYNCTEAATGPFVAIEVGGGSSATPANNGPITGLAMGWMVGFRHPDSAPTKNSSWNFGVGIRVDPKAQVLADGFIPNQPPPAGETAVRFKTEPHYGAALFVQLLTAEGW
jgi:hypothetical protein